MVGRERPAATTRMGTAALCLWGREPGHKGSRTEGVSRDANLVLADILAREPREGAVNTAIALLEEWEGWLGADQFVDAARDVLRRHRDGVALSGSTGQGGGNERSGDGSGQ